VGDCRLLFVSSVHKRGALADHLSPPDLSMVQPASQFAWSPSLARLLELEPVWWRSWPSALYMSLLDACVCVSSSPGRFMHTARRAAARTSSHQQHSRRSAGWCSGRS
jgi:hypothetical protein